MRLIAMALGLLLLALGLLVVRRRRRGAAQPVATVPPADDYALALGHYDAGRSLEALAGLRRTITARPDFPEAYFKLGNVLADLGRLGEAEAAYRDAVRLKPDFHQVHNNLGNLLRFNGLLDEAEAAFRDAIASQPDFAEAHSNLGILLVESGTTEAAEAAFRQALNSNPACVDALYNLALLLEGGARQTEAEAAYRQVLRLNRDFAEARKALGVLLAKTGRQQEAQTHFRDALRLYPDDVEARISLAQALAESGQASEAEAVYHQALAIQPDHGDVHVRLANLLAGAGRPDEAESAYRQALASKPGDADVLNNLGNLLQESGRLGEAEVAYRQVLTGNPSDTSALNNLGSLLRRAHRISEAEAVYRKALDIDAGKVLTLNNLGALWMVTGRFQQAEAVYRQSLEIEPSQDLLRFNLAHLRLLQGDFAEGWESFEYRWQTDMKDQFRGFSEPRWDGKAFVGKTLLVQHEQGFGDSIQFARYLSQLAAMGGRLLVECPAVLLRLFRASLPADVQLVKYHEEALPAFDLYCPMLSLPLHFQTRLETIPAELPYLKPPPEAVASSPLLRAQPGAPLLVGLVWAGNPKHNNDHNRSLTLSGLEPLFAVPGITWVILQIERRPDGFERLAAERGWLDPMGGVKDFADTAALIAQLDLVIGVDTSVIHLAGALAKPVWLLLPLKPDWRWLLEREDSPWYPGMRLFRQRAYNDWPELIQRVADALLARQNKQHSYSEETR
jgi:Tfp pilus assembly protein PilF